MGLVDKIGETQKPQGSIFDRVDSVLKKVSDFSKKATGNLGAFETRQDPTTGEYQYRANDTVGRSAAISEISKKQPATPYTFADLGKDLVNLGISWVVKPVADVGLTGAELVSGKSLGSLPSFGPKATPGHRQIFSPSFISSWQTLDAKNVAESSSPFIGHLKTAFEAGLDTMMMAGIANGVPRTVAEVAFMPMRAAVRQLPDSLLFKLNSNAIPINVQDLRSAVTRSVGEGAQMTAGEKAATDFIKKLSIDEQKALYKAVGIAEKEGAPFITSQTKSPTALGEFAQVGAEAAIKGSLPQLPGLAENITPQSGFAGRPPRVPVGRGEVAPKVGDSFISDMGRKIKIEAIKGLDAVVDGGKYTIPLASLRTWNKIEPEVGQPDVVKQSLDANKARLSKEGWTGSGMNDDSALTTEARKYKTAEEFVKAQPTYYHGTNRSFSEFDNAPPIAGHGTNGAFGNGLYFTDSPAYAQKYADYAVKKSGGVGSVKDVTLDIKKPFIIDKNTSLADIKKIAEVSADYPTLHNPTSPGDTALNYIIDNPKKFTENLKAQGYDGVIATLNRGKENFKEIVVFDKSQVKTKSQLTDIWKKANEGDYDIGKLRGQAQRAYKEAGKLEQKYMGKPKAEAKLTIEQKTELDKKYAGYVKIYTDFYKKHGSFDTGAGYAKLVDENGVDLYDQATPKTHKQAVTEAKSADAKRLADDFKPQGASQTVGEIKKDVKETLEQYAEDAGYKDLKVIDVEVIGSRVRGSARPDSDLDIVVQYKGSVTDQQVVDLVRDSDFGTGQPVHGHGEVGFSNLYTDLVATKKPLNEYLSEDLKLQTKPRVGAAYKDAAIGKIDKYLELPTDEQKAVYAKLKADGQIKPIQSPLTPKQEERMLRLAKESQKLSVKDLAVGDQIKIRRKDGTERVGIVKRLYDYENELRAEIDYADAPMFGSRSVADSTGAEITKYKLSESELAKVEETRARLQDASDHMLGRGKYAENESPLAGYTKKDIAYFRKFFEKQGLTNLSDGELAMKIADELAAPVELSTKGVTELQNEVVEDVIAELDLSEKGSREYIDTTEFYGSNEGMKVIAQPSTFPQWIPEELRLRTLVDKVIADMQDRELGRVPKPGTREDRLLRVVLDETNKRLATRDLPPTEIKGLEPLKKQALDIDAEFSGKAAKEFFDSLPDMDTMPGAPPPPTPPKPPAPPGGPAEPEPKIPKIKASEEITKRYAEKLLQDIKSLGGIDSPTIAQDLNDFGGYHFASNDEVQALLKKVEGKFGEAKVVKGEVKIKEKKPTARDKEIAKMIMATEKEMKALLSKAQRTAIQNLHAQAKPSEQSIFYRTEEKQSWLRKIKEIKSEKALSGNVIARLKDVFGIDNLKMASQAQLQAMKEFLDTLQPEDKFLSEKQLIGLQDILKDIKQPEIIPTRILIDKFGDKEEIMPTGVTGRVLNELLPTVDIKEGHPLVAKVVDKADALLTEAGKEVERRDQNLSEMLDKAEKSRKALLTSTENVKRGLVPQNKEIFQALGGFPVELTKEERAVVAYLKNFFAKVRDDLQLEKYRKNYVTHLEQPLMEAIVNKGLMGAVKDIFKIKRDSVPINIMLELDNIIGSNKFFKFALPRSGYGEPTTDIRKIVHVYSNLYETKMALDKVLPEGQAITQLLLQPRSAMWMKRFLQNLKGRGLDQNFRTGKMAWLSRVADGIVDISYLKLLGVNYMSALKNIVAGESNSFIYEDFNSYLTGKQRFITSPKRLIKMAQDYGILDGTFADYAQRGIGRLKKIQDWMMIGQQWGEAEIRSSLFGAKLTPQEWETGKISSARVREIKNDVAITQGIFSKTETPLWLQTWYGRLFMQMNRWRITNAMLFRRLAKGAYEEAKSGNYTGPNSRRFAKAFILYAIGMYYSYELGKAGSKRAAQVAQAMAENINSVIQLVTMKPIADIFTNNPTLSLFKELAFSAQELASYIGVPGVVEPKRVQFQNGIEDTFIAPLERAKELFGATEQDSGSKRGLPALPGLGSSSSKVNLPGVQSKSKMPSLPGL